MRKVTNKLIELVEEGLLDSHTLIVACLTYMSEDEVADMAHINGLIEEEDDDQE